MKNMSFTRDEIKRHLQANGAEQQELFKHARQVRNEAGGDGLNIRGVIELSNRCAENCLYCAMRRDNHLLDRYDLDEEAVVAAAGQIINSGIPTVFMQSGESAKCAVLLESVIPKIFSKHRCDILLCAGKKSAETYKRYKEAGTTGYILKFEAANPSLYENATGASYEERLSCIRDIRSAGMKLGTGNILGLPNQTLDDIADDILLAIELSPDYVSVAPFIPNQGTPYENASKGDINLTLNVMAIWRIAFPDALIPTVSALEYIHPDGQAAGLSAGANVITVNFTPKQNRDKYAIYAKDRFVVGLEHAYKTARRAGMSLNMRKK
ncbi:MAG: radical SAM protein [Oscillospiraceae bacterium]|nr:radical SAM protein [Oscillospiraceae bacterium]